MTVWKSTDGKFFAKNRKGFTRKFDSREAAQSFTKEETELSEVSKETLSSYIDKAKKDSYRRWMTPADDKHVTKKGKSLNAKYLKSAEYKQRNKKLENRHAGIKLATKKLGEETCASEKKEMSILKKLEKKTDKMIAKDAEVHKKISEATRFTGKHFQHYRKLEPGETDHKPVDDSHRLKKGENESHADYNKRLSKHLLSGLLKKKD